MASSNCWTAGSPAWRSRWKMTLSSERGSPWAALARSASERTVLPRKRSEAEAR